MGYLENLWNALDFGSLWDLLLRLVSVFLCLTVHETCHGWLWGTPLPSGPGG